MASPHDALFKYVFRQPEHAASELRAIFPAALSAQFDWATLQLEPASFVDEELRGRHADLLFSVRCERQTAYVYVLFEHQSTSDPLMAFRLLRYVVRIWDLALLAFVRGRGAALPALRRWIEVFRQVQRSKNGLEALVAFWEYALQVGDMNPKDLSELAREIGPKASEAYVTAAEILCVHAKAEGLAQGKAELVLRQLQLKFGLNPAAYRQRVLTASPDELDVWADRIITASSVDEVMGTERGKRP